jgi:RimJ/RimL family protein N-acetyltransferase
LRQSKPLTEEDQHRYFNDVISKLFDQENPNQILFSFLRNEECVGYGGLVHINWHDKNAEISFLMNTTLENDNFHQFWKIYLLLIEEVAFHELSLHKIYTYAYDLRPQLYNILEASGFHKEAVLKEHVLFDKKFINVIIHAKLNTVYNLRLATLNDLSITFKWANDTEVRRFSINRNPITWEDHQTWFKGKISDPSCRYFILTDNCEPVGSVRFDIDSFNNAEISYLIDPQFHGKKLGTQLLKNGIEKLQRDYKGINSVLGYVMKENIASIKIFEKLSFENVNSENSLLKFKKQIRNENC